LLIGSGINVSIVDEKAGGQSSWEVRRESPAAKGKGKLTPLEERAKACRDYICGDEKRYASTTVKRGEKCGGQKNRR